jgi:non-heme chloroperoxidase
MIMNRRILLGVGLTGAALAGLPEARARPPMGHAASRGTLLTRDDVSLAVRDHGEGRPILFLAAWCFASDAWGFHIEQCVRAGFRAVTYDRRGHGASEDSGQGYDADTLADDLAGVIEGLGLERVTLVAHSLGTLEAVRYVARHGTNRIARLILVAPVTPCLTHRDDNPDGVPAAAFDKMRGEMAEDFPAWIARNEPPFFTLEISPETRAHQRRMMESVPLPVALACHRAITNADTRSDLAKIDRPALIIHGDKDESMPLALTSLPTHRLIPRSRIVIYEGAPHGLPITHKARLVADILAQAG